MNTAQNILEQLGGNRFLAMTGAKNLVNTGVGLQFDAGGKKLVITLDADDTYTVQAGKLNRKTFEFVYSHNLSDVYADELRATFTKITGLDTSL